jgi:hypothetical protein
MQEIMKLFREKSGKPSYSRIFGAGIISVLMVITAKVAWVTGAIPDIPANWAMLAGGLYGFNAFKTNGKS